MVVEGSQMTMRRLLADVPSDRHVLQKKLSYRDQLKRYMSACDADALLSAKRGEMPEVEIRPEHEGKVLGILYRRNAEAQR